MAYPFAQMPSLGEFVGKACSNHDCVKKQTRATVLGPRGRAPSEYLERELSDGTKAWAMLPNIEADERLTDHRRQILGKVPSEKRIPEEVSQGQPGFSSQRKSDGDLGQKRQPLLACVIRKRILGVIAHKRKYKTVPES